MNGTSKKTHTNGAAKAAVPFNAASSKADLFATIERYGEQCYQEGRIAGFRRAALLMTQHTRARPITDVDSFYELLDIMQDEVTTAEKKLR